MARTVQVSPPSIFYQAHKRRVRDAAPYSGAAYQVTKEDGRVTAGTLWWTLSPVTHLLTFIVFIDFCVHFSYNHGTTVNKCFRMEHWVMKGCGD